MADTGTAEPRADAWVDGDDQVSCRLTANVLAYTADRYGAEVVDRIVARVGLPRERLEDTFAWTSYAAYNRLWQALVEVTGDADVGYHIGRASLRSRALSYFLTIARAIGAMGNVALGMRYLPDIINRSTRCVRYRTLEVVGNTIALEVSEPRSMPFVKARCDFRVGLFEGLPSMAGAGPESVEVVHTQCMGDGYPACVYEVRWTVPRKRSWLLAWSLGGVLAGAAATGWAVVAGLPLAGVLPLALFAVVTFVLFGLGRERGAWLRESGEVLQAQRDEVIRANEEVESRGELLDKARADLERRTGELEATQATLVRTERLAAMGRMVSGMAHELNNPLAAILTNAEVLRRVEDPERIVPLAGQIADQVERCSRLIRNMLAFGRQQPAERVPVDLGAIVERALELHAFELRMQQIAIERPEPGSVAPVLGDPGQLQQLVVNLVQNAVQALATVDGPRRLSIGLDETDDGIALWVEDNGPGIPDGAGDEVFEPFFTTKPAGEGTGLGLSICHGIISSHGGTIQLGRGADGGGTRADVMLPSSGGLAPATRRVVEGRAVDSLPPARPGTTPAVSSDVSRRPTMPPLEILVVDDERPILAATCELLAGYGHEVRGCATADEARAVAAERGDQLDALLIDLRMPGESGVELYTTLPAPLQARVVFMTGALAFRSADEFLSRFWGRFVEKPFTYEALCDALERVRTSADARAESPPGT